jgi:hypothetical protein
MGVGKLTGPIKSGEGVTRWITKLRCGVYRSSFFSFYSTDVVQICPELDLALFLSTTGEPLRLAREGRWWMGRSILHSHTCSHLLRLDELSSGVLWRVLLLGNRDACCA